jgi:RimJ/RimL family protein N-acetyltransferase
MIELGRALGFARVEALCYADHPSSARVLEKAGMIFEGVLRKHGLFPNLSAQPQDVRSYAWTS